MRKRTNRFDVQVVLDDGGAMGLKSRTDGEPLTRAEVVNELTWFLGRIRNYDDRKAKERAEAGR